ncbi:hypothetical protein PPL_03320 [Heterostelium album PN500]|uniref:Uncharacterized protein n=1 Tax=Heterostelium pallidum (strain ATCC 26659 / Pp 5 / PN500) TaxID=670386 RepID=D3B4J5_HETP5|nr:hypothetical protein PPL_03320 [Heterostelium album PN500]EFA84243.1 hypothetical protein PPL_03320 [Heterostelium album PN500]|eukprot:XP_020436359.1 hypothetical protein PPL_03320 [Heterostelium album PN500]
MNLAIQLLDSYPERCDANLIGSANQCALRADHFKIAYQMSKMLESKFPDELKPSDII